MPARPSNESPSPSSAHATAHASTTSHIDAQEAVVLEVKEASQAGTLAHGASRLDEQSRQMFVSPRVIDDRSFEQYASTLRTLAAEAANQAKSLMQAGDGVRTLSDSLRGLTKDLTVRAEGAVKILPQLDAKVSSANALLERVSREAAIAKAREARDAITQQVQQQIAALAPDLIRQEVERATDAIAQQVRARLQSDVLPRLSREALASLTQQQETLAQPAPVSSTTVGPLADALAQTCESWTKQAASTISAEADAARASLQALSSAASQSAAAATDVLGRAIEAARAERQSLLRETGEATQRAHEAHADLREADERFRADLRTSLDAGLEATLGDGLASTIESRVRPLIDAAIEDRLAQSFAADVAPRYAALHQRAEDLLRALSERVEAAAHAADAMPLQAAPIDPLAQATQQALQCAQWLSGLVQHAQHTGLALQSLLQHAHAQTPGAPYSPEQV